MLYITVPDLNDSLSLITLDDKQYMIRFTYNMLYDYWVLGLYQDDESPILVGIKIVPNYNLLTPYKDPLLPPGELAVLSSGVKIGRDGFKDGIAQLIYLEKSDLVSLGG